MKMNQHLIDKYVITYTHVLLIFSKAKSLKIPKVIAGEIIEGISEQLPEGLRDETLQEFLKEPLREFGINLLSNF